MFILSNKMKSSFRSWTILAIISLTVTMLPGIGPRNTIAAEPTPICVAVRGNGPLIFAHFPALARMAEHFGPFEGVAGGSSGSITSFLTESMHMHPLLYKDGDGSDNTTEVAGARLSLMYKSIDGFLLAASSWLLHDTMTALNDIVVAMGSEIDALIAQEKEADAWALLLVELEDLGELINQEPLDLIANSNNSDQHIRDIWDSIKHFLAFNASDPLILIRPGMANFDALAADFGNVGSFFAGYGTYDADAWELYFDNCAMQGRGKSPDEVAAMTMSEGGQSCGDYLDNMAETWLAASLPLPEESTKNRIYDNIGENFLTLAITSVMTGAAATEIRAAKDTYFDDATHWLPAVDFDDIKAGYWGKDTDTQKVVANSNNFQDLKTAMARALPYSQWKDILSVSPAEPGLSRALAITGTTSDVSAGGWADLAPVLALKNAGCEHVVYVTRQGQESSFAQGVSELLGSTEAERQALFDLGDPTSGFSLSLKEAAGVFCTDWDSYGVTSVSAIEALINDAWNAPFEIHDPTLVPVWGPVHGKTNYAGLTGCTPVGLQNPSNILFMILPVLSTINK